MKILLSEFEHQIDEIILKRGLQYYPLVTAERQIMDINF